MLSFRANEPQRVKLGQENMYCGGHQGYFHIMRYSLVFSVKYQSRDRKNDNNNHKIKFIPVLSAKKVVSFVFRATNFDKSCSRGQHLRHSYK